MHPKKEFQKLVCEGIVNLLKHVTKDYSIDSNLMTDVAVIYFVIFQRQVNKLIFFNPYVNKI
jgi:hypothetical protein